MATPDHKTALLAIKARAYSQHLESAVQNLHRMAEGPWRDFLTLSEQEQAALSWMLNDISEALEKIIPALEEADY